ncbi:MAG: ABC transporter permease subunit [Candidatus Micrarchaeota archaeon]|nr:ABC transporter permease subunit [Candidatus Micrarchaeota archaeon]
MFAALFASMAISLIVGIYIATSRSGERIALPLVDILQTLPILTFFPFVVLVVLNTIPNTIGLNLAVIILIITSMLWNMILGVYESVKTIPNELLEVGRLYKLSPVEKLRRIFIPASMPRLVEQSILSWSIGLFYLVTSEIFSVGNSCPIGGGGACHVQRGIGVAIAQLAPDSTGYLIGIAVFIAFVVATRFIFFRPLEEHFRRYMKGSAIKPDRMTTYRKIAKEWAERVQRVKLEIGIKKRSLKAADDILMFRRELRKRYHRISVGTRMWYAVFALLAVLVVAYLSANYSSFIANEPVVLLAMLFSFIRVWMAYVAIVAVALPVCVYLVFMSRRRSGYITLFQIMASIPATILLPWIALNLDNGELVAFAVFFLAGIWYVIFGVMANASTIPSSIFEVRRIFGVRGLNAWKSIYVKALLPGLITGSITAIAAEWNASIVAEYFTSSGISGLGGVYTQVGSIMLLGRTVPMGIGYLLDTALANGQLVVMGFAIFNLVVMIIVINRLVWRRMYSQIAKTYR